MGGYVGQAYAQTYPEKLKGFVSIDSAPLQRYGEGGDDEVEAGYFEIISVKR